MADPLDILGSDESTFAALGVDTGHEDRIPQLVTAVSRRIDALCGPVVQREVTEYHDGGQCAIWPRLTPVASVTSLKEFDGTVVTTLTPGAFGIPSTGDGYLLESSPTYAHAARVLRRSGGGGAYFTPGPRSVELVYVAGRYESTDDVDPLFKSAAAMILRRAWDREASAWARGQDPFEEQVFTGNSRFFNAVDHVVREQLAHELLPPGVA